MCRHVRVCVFPCGNHAQTLAAPRTTEAQTEQLEGPDIAEGGLLRQDNVDDPVMWYVVMLKVSKRYWVHTWWLDISRQFWEWRWSYDQWSRIRGWFGLSWKVGHVVFFWFFGSAAVSQSYTIMIIMHFEKELQLAVHEQISIWMLRGSCMAEWFWERSTTPALCHNL